MQVIIGDPIDPGYLSKFEKKYDDEKTKGYVSKETRFQYAWCLIRSNNTDDIKKGIVLLDAKEDQKAIKGDHRYILFYLSVAYYKLNEYEKALRFIRALLRSEPENKQALDMEKLVNKALMNDGLFGIAIVGAIGLAVAGLASLVTFAVEK